MMRLSILLFCSVLFYTPVSVSAPSPTCGAEWSRLLIDDLLNRDLTAAEATVDQWSAFSPGHVSIPLHRALIEVARADYSRSRDAEKYNQPLNMLAKVIEQTRTQVEAEPSAYLPRLNLATASAVAGRLLMEQHHWLRAYKHGHEAREIVQKLLDEDPQRHDTKLILGLFEYFSGTLPNVLRWLSHLIDFSGDAEKGIAYLESAVEKAAVAAPQAAESLLVELEHTSEQACRYQALASTMRQRYPENPRYSWASVRLKRLCSKLPEDQRSTPKTFIVAPSSCH